jgi:hypothetical protein
MLASVAEANMQELELTSWRLLRVWWAISWRWMAIYLGIAGATLLVLSAVGLVLRERFHLPGDFVAHLFIRPLVLVWLASLPLAGLMATRLALGSRIGQFRIVFAVPAEPLPAVEVA